MNYSQKYLEAANKGCDWIESRLKPNGELLGCPLDLSCYYHVPTLLMLHGKWKRALTVLDFIKNQFMQPNGDFLSSKDIKSENPAYCEFWNYMNGWIAVAAQRMGRFDISFPAWKFLDGFYNDQLGGWKPHRISNEEGVIDILSTAHLGLASLYFGNLDKAIACGSLLEKFFVEQKDLSKFYLRMSSKGELIKNYPQEMAIFEHVNRHESNQPYFMIGYPIAFLIKLFQATSYPKYLEVAEYYFHWVYQCSGNLRAFFFSHKVAWGAALLAETTGSPQALELTRSIADYLVSTQDSNGSWLASHEVLASCDQTVEIAIWLTEIANANEPAVIGSFA